MAYKYCVRYRYKNETLGFIDSSVEFISEFDFKVKREEIIERAKIEIKQHCYSDNSVIIGITMVEKLGLKIK